MLLASAALPFAFHAVEVDKEFFWDGGYVGNPSLYPLFYATRTSDLLLVQINPLIRDDVPDSAQEIIERVNEISFNTALLHELRAIAFVERLLREHKLDPARYKRINMHAIDAEDRLRKYGASSKTYTSPGFLKELFELGRRTTSTGSSATSLASDTRRACGLRSASCRARRATLVQSAVMSSTFGHLFRVTNFGESHGPAIGCVIDGCPPGLPLSAADLQPDLDRRKPGTSRHVTQRRESDEVEILSGLFEGVTSGTPIALLIRNSDQRSKDYDNLLDTFRPGHADYTYWRKYGLRDPRGGGRSSARLTAPMVAAGAVAKKWLRGFTRHARAWLHGADRRIRHSIHELG